MMRQWAWSAFHHHYRGNRHYIILKIKLFIRIHAGQAIKSGQQMARQGGFVRKRGVVLKNRFSFKTSRGNTHVSLILDVTVAFYFFRAHYTT